MYNAIIITCKDDPVAEDHLNDHVTILESHPPYALVRFLDGTENKVLIENLRDCSN